jgi:glycosyltransferase involved in cell wall biosynthesis
MKTVAYVIRPAEGGMLKHLIDLIGNLDRERFSPVVISPPGNDLALPLGRIGAELIEVDIADKPNLARDVSSIGKLATGLTAIAPDILHAHSNKAALLAEMAVKRGGLDVPVLFSVHNFPSYAATGGFRGKISSIAMRRVLMGADKVIAVSNNLKEYLVNEEKAAPGKIDVIYNGIDADGIADAVKATDTRSLKQSLGIRDGAPVVGTIARLIPSKGLEFLIDAAPGLIHKQPGLRIVIVGSGPLEQSLKKRVSAAGMSDTFIFTGHVADPKPYYAMFDVFVMPTLKESFGMTIVEAMAAGCPVVASRTGGVPEIVINRETGLLVAPGESGQLAGAIRQLLTDRKAASKMAEEARRVVRNKFTITEMVKSTEAVYLGLTKSGSF